jgi:hypothetical protein
MPGDLKIISVDDHVLEPKTVWQDRVPAKYRDRVAEEVRHVRALTWTPMSSLALWSAWSACEVPTGETGDTHRSPSPTSVALACGPLAPVRPEQAV